MTFTLRMLRKAYGQGQRVLVTAAAPLLDELSRQLWLSYEREFIAHVLVAGKGAALAHRTPLWLGTGVTAVENEPLVVVNLGASAPADPARLQRLIEVVAADVDSAAAGRLRWRQYIAAGFQIKHQKAGAGV